MSADGRALPKTLSDGPHIYHHRLAEILSRNRKFIKLIENGYRVENVKFLYGLELDNASLKITNRYALVTVTKGDELKSVFVDTISGKILEIFNAKKLE